MELAPPGESPHRGGTRRPEAAPHAARRPLFLRPHPAGIPVVGRTECRHARPHPRHVSGRGVALVPNPPAWMAAAHPAHTRQRGSAEIRTRGRGSHRLAVCLSGRHGSEKSPARRSPASFARLVVRPRGRCIGVFHPADAAANDRPRLSGRQGAVAFRLSFHRPISRRSPTRLAGGISLPPFCRTPIWPGSASAA